MVFEFLATRHVGILAPRPGIEPAPPALEGEVSTTGPPGKSQKPTVYSPELTPPGLSGLRERWIPPPPSPLPEPWAFLVPQLSSTQSPKLSAQQNTTDS